MLSSFHVASCVCMITRMKSFILCDGEETSPNLVVKTLKNKQLKNHMCTTNNDMNFHIGQTPFEPTTMPGTKSASILRIYVT